MGRVMLEGTGYRARLKQQGAGTSCSPVGLTNVSGPLQVPQPGTPGPSASDHMHSRLRHTPSLCWKEVCVSQEGWETQPRLPQLPSPRAEWRHWAGRGWRKEEETGFPGSTACGANSCSGDLIEEKEGSRTGQESKAGRNVVSAGDSLQPDPTVGSGA